MWIRCIQPFPLPPVQLISPMWIERVLDNLFCLRCSISSRDHTKFLISYPHSNPIFEIICEQGPLLRLSKSMSKNCFANYSHPPWYKLYLRTACEHKTVWHCLEQDVWRRFEGMWTWTCNSIRWYQIRTLSVVQWASVRVTISFSIWIKDRSSIQKKRASEFLNVHSPNVHFIWFMLVM